MLLVLGPIAVIVGLLMRRATAGRPHGAARSAASGRAPSSGRNAFDVGADGHADARPGRRIRGRRDGRPLIDRLAFGGQTGDDQRRAGADVGRPDRCAAQPRHAADDGVVAVGADVGPESLQLLDVAETARVQVLGDDADSRRRPTAS